MIFATLFHLFLFKIKKHTGCANWTGNVPPTDGSQVAIWKKCSKISEVKPFLETWFHYSCIFALCNIQVTTGLNVYTITPVWVWENFFLCLSLMSSWWLQSFQPQGVCNCYRLFVWYERTKLSPKLLLISPSAILSKQTLLPSSALFFTLCVAWKRMEEQGEKSLFILCENK